MASTTRGSWFLRHRWLTGICAVALLVALADGNDDEAEATSSDSTAVEVEAPDGPVGEVADEAEVDAAADSEKSRSEEESPDDEGVRAASPADSERAAATPTPRRTPQPGSRPRTHLVTRTIDGDTIELANGRGVRIVGIDTPERGECGFEQASANMDRLVTGKRVRLTVSDEDTDRYGRLLRYVDISRTDAGLAQIRAGLAIARYDSRDGYGFHAREDQYIAVDSATRSRAACPPEPKPVAPAPAPAPASASAYYENCDAARAAGGAPVRRGGPGYGTHLDRDGDGIGCE